MENKTKKVFRTWEGWCLLKLKEIGKSTIKQWADAMGYKSYTTMTNMAKRMEKEGKLIVKATQFKRRYTYEIKDNDIL